MCRSLNSEDWSIFAPLEGIMERMGLANLSILIQQASNNHDGSIQWLKISRPRFDSWPLYK